MMQSRHAFESHVELPLKGLFDPTVSLSKKFGYARDPRHPAAIATARLDLLKTNSQTL